MRTGPTSSIVLGVLATAVLVGCVTRQERAALPIAAGADVVRELHATRPAFAELTADDQALVYLWLHANCAEGFDAQQAQFTATGARLEAALIEAFKMGPPSTFLGELAAARHKDYEAIMTPLADDERPFPPELQKQLLTLSEEAYVNDGLQRTVATYKLAALDGLGLVGSQVAMTWLERTARTLDDPELRPGADRALAALRTRARR